MAASAPVPIARVQIGLGQRRGIVDAVAGKRDRVRARQQVAQHRDLLLGPRSGKVSSDAMPTRAATRQAARWLSPVSSTGRRPISRSAVTAAAEGFSAMLAGTAAAARFLDPGHTILLAAHPQDPEHSNISVANERDKRGCHTQLK
jgi:hypothetical protein